MGLFSLTLFLGQLSSSAEPINKITVFGRLVQYSVKSGGGGGGESFYYRPLPQAKKMGLTTWYYLRWTTDTLSKIYSFLNLKNHGLIHKSFMTGNKTESLQIAIS